MTHKANMSFISLYDIENNAVRSICALLRKKGFKVFEIYFKNWVNNRFYLPKEKELDNLINMLRNTHTEIAGISLRASAYLKVAAMITERIKKELGIPVIWGGIHSTLVPEECIEIADIVCVGEGEYPILELLTNISEHRPIEMIENLWIKTQSGAIIKNALRPLIANLDELPFLDYTAQDKYYIDADKVSIGDPLLKRPLFRAMASRGCFYECSFCYNSAMKRIYKDKGKYFRYRSVNNVIAELLHAKRVFKNLKFIRFDDEIFIFDKSWIKDFCIEYKKEIDLPFECFLTPGNYEEELLYQLKDAGLRVIYMGIEGPNRINRILYNRGFSEENILNNVKMFHGLGLNARYQVIIDDPLSTEEDKKGLFEFLMKFPRPFELYLFSLTVFPKTLLAEKLLALGLIKESDIEGRATKTFSQLRVDLSCPRSKSDQFWVSLMVLVTKNFIPKNLICKLSKSKILYKHPSVLIIFSQICNFIKMIWVVFMIILKGELTFDMVKQWLNPKSLVTQ